MPRICVTSLIYVSKVATGAIQALTANYLTLTFPILFQTHPPMVNKSITRFRCPVPPLLPPLTYRNQISQSDICTDAYHVCHFLFWFSWFLLFVKLHFLLCSCLPLSDNIYVYVLFAFCQIFFSFMLAIFFWEFFDVRIRLVIPPTHDDDFPLVCIPSFFVSLPKLIGTRKIKLFWCVLINVILVIMLVIFCYWYISLRNTYSIFYSSEVSSLETYISRHYTKKHLAICTNKDFKLCPKCLYSVVFISCPILHEIDIHLTRLKFVSTIAEFSKYIHIFLTISLQICCHIDLTSALKHRQSYSSIISSLPLPCPFNASLAQPHTTSHLRLFPFLCIVT